MIQSNHRTCREAMHVGFVSRDRGLLTICILLFLTSAVATVRLCTSMSGGMPMPGGWTLSMVWMKVPGQNWSVAAARFLEMWLVMMMAMMLPSLVPTLLSYRRSFQDLHVIRLGQLTALAAAGYFSLWSLFGLATYILGIVLAITEMRRADLAQHVPLATAAGLLVAGLFQLTAWKAGQLNKCRNPQACNSLSAPNARNAWRVGFNWGIDCALCCLGFMAALLVTGVMNLVAMVLLAIGITAERLLPKPNYASKITGVMLIMSGAFILI